MAGGAEHGQAILRDPFWFTTGFEHEDTPNNLRDTREV